MQKKHLFLTALLFAGISLTGCSQTSIETIPETTEKSVGEAETAETQNETENEKTNEATEESKDESVVSDDNTEELTENDAYIQNGEYDKITVSSKDEINDLIDKYQKKVIISENEYSKNDYSEEEFAKLIEKFGEHSYNEFEGKIVEPIYAFEDGTVLTKTENGPKESAINLEDGEGNIYCLSSISFNSENEEDNYLLVIPADFFEAQYNLRQEMREKEDVQ